MLAQGGNQVIDHQVEVRGAGDVGALEVERGRAHVPAAILVANAVGGGHAHVLEEDLVEADVVDHVREGARGDAGGLHVDQEVGDALVFGRVGIGAGEQDHPVALVGAGGPDLRAVDHVVVAVADGARLQAGEVGAGAGLAEALAPALLAAQDAGQVALLLLVGAVEQDGGAGPAQANAAEARRARLGQLLVEDELLHHGEAAAAILRGPVRRDPGAGAHGVAPALPGGARGSGRAGIEGGAEGGAAAQRVGQFAVDEAADVVAEGGVPG